MIRLAFAQLRRRGWRYFSLFFAIFAAVGLTVGTAAIVESLQATVNGMFDKPYANTTYVAQVRTNNPDEVLDALPGAEKSFDQQASISFKPADDSGSLYSSTTIRGIQDGLLQWREVLEGKLPEGPGEVAVVDDTPLGTQLDLKVPNEDTDVLVTVVGRVEQSAQEQLNGAKSLLVDAAMVRQWAMPRNSNLGTAVGELRIHTDAPLAEVKAQLPSQSVTDLATSKQQTEKLAGKYLNGRDQYFLLLTAFMLIVAVVAILVIFSTYSVLAADRQREFALLRAVGASSGQLLGSTVVESLVLALLAGATGIPAGMWAADWAGKHADKLGVRVPLTDVTLDPQWIAAIFAAGLVVSVVAAMPAARGAISKSLVDSLTASAPKQSRASLLLAGVLGVFLCAAGGYGLVASESMKARRALVVAISGSGLIVIGAALLLAVLLPWLIFQLSRLVAAVPTLQLGMAFVGRQRLRSGALVAIVLAGTALVSAVLSGQTELRTYLMGKATDKGAVDVVVRALDSTAEPELVDSLTAVPGVHSVASPVALPIESPSGARDTALALSTQEGEEVLRGPITGAGVGELVLGANSPLRNVLPDGRQAAISIRGQEHDLMVRYSDGLESFVDPAVTPQLPAVARPGVDTRLPNPFMLVRLDGDVSQPADSPTITALREAAAHSGEEVSFQEAFSARENVADSASRVLSLSTLMSIVALLIAGIGVVNTVSLMVRERHRDFSLLLALGMGTLGRTRVQFAELFVSVLPAAVVGMHLGDILGLRIATVLTGVEQFALSLCKIQTEHFLTLIGSTVFISLAVNLGGMANRATTGLGK